MKAINLLLLGTLLVAVHPVLSQDSMMVKKPSPQTRAYDQMPIRKGRGNAQPMPSPQYRPRLFPRPIPTDTSLRRSRRDTVR